MDPDTKNNDEKDEDKSDEEETGVTGSELQRDILGCPNPILDAVDYYRAADVRDINDRKLRSMNETALKEGQPKFFFYVSVYLY